MDSAQLTSQLKQTDNGRLLLSGELSMTTVPELLKQDRFFVDGMGDVQVDLQDVQRADSAGVALLIEWQRKARQQRRNICIQNMPPQMLAIARLSGVDELLSLS